MLWLFHIFCSDAPIACPLLSLLQNSVVHSPSSVIRDPRYTNVFICASCSFWMSMRHAMHVVARHYLGLVRLDNIDEYRLYLRLTRSRRSTNSCSSAAEVAVRMMSSAYWPRFVIIRLKFVVHPESRRESSSSPSQLGCWTSIWRKDKTLSGTFLKWETILILFPILWP